MRMSDMVGMGCFVCVSFVFNCGLRGWVIQQSWSSQVQRSSQLSKKWVLLNRRSRIHMALAESLHITL